MRLEVVTGRAFTCSCISCERKMRAGDPPDTETVYADLDGPAFRAYYCAVCAGDARASNSDWLKRMALKYGHGGI